MKTLAAYVSVTGGDRTLDLATRFALSWRRFPPSNRELGLTVICNGGPPAWFMGPSFPELNPKWFPRPNIGADIGGYIDLARSLEGFDAILCMGESVFFHRAGWMDRIEEVWNRLGPGFYGFFSSNLVNPHLNTTAFLCPPNLLAGYPEPVTNREQRYAFEHGKYSMWRRVQRLGLPVRLITWDGDYGPGEWRAPNNILWKGDQSNCLFFCIHTERWCNAPDGTRVRWCHNANAGL